MLDTMGKHRRILIRGVIGSDLHFVIILSWTLKKETIAKTKTNTTTPQNRRVRNDNYPFPHPLPA